jgi:hypothetical protein
MISKVSLQTVALSFFMAVGIAAIVSPLVGEMQSAAGGATAPAASSSEPNLDYEFFKTRVEPIFLKKRSPAHARCYSCHQERSHKGPFHLAQLSPGESFWTEEQSRRNFEVVSKLVYPGKPLSGMFPKHPLAPEAGGDAVLIHNGGRQFESQNDPDFQTIVAWINGQKMEGSSKQ